MMKSIRKAVLCFGAVALAVCTVHAYAQIGGIVVGQTAPTTNATGTTGVQPELAQPPAAGSHIYLFEVGEAFSGGSAPPNDLLYDADPDCSTSGNTKGLYPDPNGSDCYILSDSGGNFTIDPSVISALQSYDYCNLDAGPVYFLTRMASFFGNPANPYAVHVTPLQGITCGPLPTSQFYVYINDETNVASAFTLAPFANLGGPGTDTLGISGKVSNNGSSIPALTAAFSASNFISSSINNGPGDIYDSTAYPSNAASINQLNTLADIMDVCQNNYYGLGGTVGGDPPLPPCAAVLLDTTTPTSVPYVPQDIWQAALSMAEYPTTNTLLQYSLLNYSYVPALQPITWSPALPKAPASWTLPFPDQNTPVPAITAITLQGSSTPITSAKVGQTLTIYGTNLNPSIAIGTPYVIIGGVPQSVTVSGSNLTVKIVPTTTSGYMGVYTQIPDIVSHQPTSLASNFPYFTITH